MATKKTTIKEIISTLNIKVILLAGAALFMLISYILLGANAIRVEYAIEEAEQRIVESNKITDDLNIKLSEVSSLDHILERSDSLSYTEVRDVSYIEKPLESPFAVR